MPIDVTHNWWEQQPVSDVKGAAETSRRRHSDGLAADTIAFWSLMLFTFVLLISPQSFIPFIGKLHLAFMSAALSGGAYVVYRAVERKPVFDYSYEVILVICLLLWTITTIPFSIWPGGSISVLLSTFIKALIIFWLLTRLAGSERRLNIVAWMLSLIAIPLSFSAVRAFFSGGFVNQEASHGLDRISGYEAALTGNPNDLALMLNLILPLTVALFLSTKKPVARMLLVSIIGLSMAAIVATYSRGGFLVLGSIVIWYLWRLAKRKRLTIVFAIVFGALAILPFLPSGYLNRLSTITNISADRTGSAQQRLEGEVAAVDYIVKHPIIGAGIGMNILALNNIRGKEWEEVHNVYLVYAMELGLPGLLMYLLLCVKSVRYSRDAQKMLRKNNGSGRLEHLSEGIEISLIAFMIAACFYPEAYQFYFYYMAGLAVAVRQAAMSIPKDSNSMGSVTARAEGDDGLPAAFI